jgi:hypothetical protein
LITLVNIALEQLPLSACSNGDGDHDGSIAIDEIIMAVNRALGGCGQALSYFGGGALLGSVRVKIGQASGDLGSTVTIPVALDHSGGGVVGAQIDILFDDTKIRPVVDSHNRPICTIDRRLQQYQLARSVPTSGRLRLMVLPPYDPPVDIEGFPDGVVARCTFEIRDAAEIGRSYTLEPDKLIVSDVGGHRLPSEASAGVITAHTDFLEVLSLPNGLRVGSGLQAAGYSVRVPASPPTTLQVMIASLTPAKCLVAGSMADEGKGWISLNIEPYTTVTENFVVQGLEYMEGFDDPVGTCIVLASADNYVSGAAWLSIVQPGLAFETILPPNVLITGLPEAVSLSSSNLSLMVHTGVPKSDLSTLEYTQILRAGRTPLPVTVSLAYPPTTPTPTAAPAALVYVPPTPAQSVVVHVPAGSFFDTLQFDPLGLGTVTVSATAAGWITTQAGSGPIEISNIPTPTPGGISCPNNP